jgi:4-amino-4-deoxy-L-arabinose transferase-like glycosyltransferase
MRLLAALMAAVALPRLLLLPFNENLFGDAIPRTEMGERWMAHPHLITAFGDGAGQYGPLHLYLVGIATVFADREIAGRVVALLCGVLTVIPLYRLGVRLSGTQAGRVACLALTVWGLHIQFSTTAASEAVAILLMLSALVAFGSAMETGRTRDIVWAAAWFNLAEAVRYDAWMYPPILVGAVIVTRSESALRPRQLAGFFAGCLLFPVSWMLGNYQMHGDPTFPLDYINADHRRWAATFQGGWRQLWLRAQGIAFWPAMALISLTPGVAVLSVAGATTAWRERPKARWVILAVLAPVVYYAIRTTVFADFVPLTRYIAVVLTVMLVFVWDGYVAIAGAWGVNGARRVVQSAVALALGIPLAVGWFTFRRDGPLQDILRPISPTSTNSRAVMAGAEFIRSTVVPARHRIVVDIDEGFLDLPLVFYGGLLQERAIRVRKPADLSRVAREQPQFVVRFDRGSLLTQGSVRLSGRTLELGRAKYDELDGFSPPLHVYALRGIASQSVP